MNHHQKRTSTCTNNSSLEHLTCCRHSQGLPDDNLFQKNYRQPHDHWKQQDRLSEEYDYQADQEIHMGQPILKMALLLKTYQTRQHETYNVQIIYLTMS